MKTNMPPMIRIFAFFLVLFGSVFPILAQNGKGLPIGGWRQHTPYLNTLGICEMNGKIYAGSPSGLFYFDTEDGTISTVNKVNGLTGVGITCMQKHPTRNWLLLGYEDGNIDFIKDNTIFNLKDIAGSSVVVGSKRINQIKFYKNDALVCTDFGIVLFNLEKQEIRESNLNLSSTGSTLKVLDATRFEENFYALTEVGLMSVSVKDDFKNPLKWKLYGGAQQLPVDPSVFRAVDSLDGKLIVTTQAGFHVKNPDSFTFPLNSNRIFQSFVKKSPRLFNGEYYVAVDADVAVFDSSLQFNRLIKTEKVTRPSDCLLLNGRLWVSDLNVGLVEILDEENSNVFLPNAPIDPFSFSLYNYKDRIVSHFGGYTYGTGLNQNQNRNGFAIFENNQWTNFNKNLDARVPDVRDVVSSRFNPIDRKLYLASYGFGVMMKAEDQYSFYNDRNTGGALCNLIFPDCIFNRNTSDSLLDSSYVRVPDLDFDLFGNLWVTTNLTGPFPGDSALASRNASTGQWRKFRINTANGKSPLGITVDRNNYKWVRMAPGVNNSNSGIVIFNGDGSKQIALNNLSNQGNLPSSDVYAIKEDKQGYIWVGTQKGLAVYYNPFNAFFGNGISASTPIFPPAAGRPVLENDVVTSIEIDGGNRKWVGTKENGLWLFNPDISAVIYHFTKENSPLLSNFIYSICINKPTGELFIATDKGLISFQTDATENVDSDGRLAVEDCSNQDISIFPNPVEKGYDGQIAVKGLASNSIVKFITPSGKLVHQTIAVGGMATWNGITYEGKRAIPGIYIVMSSTSEGKSNCVSKLAILD
jgi:ligand-binding sensor domain-containing protein